MTARIITNEADKDPREALSPSIAKTLITRSPAHARHLLDHPRPPSRQMDVGSAVHAMLLGTGKPLCPVDAKNWRTKVAQAERDAAHARGEVPMLVKDVERLTEAAAVLGAKLGSAGVDLTGDSEVKIEWELDAVLCRGVPDHVAGSRIYDLKTTEDASPQTVGRTIYTMGYDIQAAAYVEAVEELRPELEGRCTFALAFVEVSPPYAVCVVELDGAFRELGRARWQRAKGMWFRCQALGEWPDYAGEIVRAEPPRWALYQEGLA